MPTDHTDEYAYLKKIFPELGDVTFDGGACQLVLADGGSWWVIRRHWGNGYISDYEALAIVERALRKRLREYDTLSEREVRYSDGTVYIVTVGLTDYRGATPLEALFKAWQTIGAGN